ncbi:hypothetical protein ABIC83_002648 [Roseateles asaccharophilus]|uniref:hypothetical protein n=1 Tax=Roseateles asaccharophilus TaxID=582607 RepID=UPI003835A326
MSETSLDRWGASKAPGDDSPVLEGDLVGHQAGDDEHGAHSGFGGDEEHHRGSEFAGGDVDAEEHAAADALAAKKKKDMRTLAIAGGVAAVLVVGLVAVKLTRGGDQYAQMEQPQPQAAQQQQQQQPDQSQVIAQVGPQAQQQAAVIDASGAQAAAQQASAVAGLDFGLQSAPPASAPVVATTPQPAQIQAPGPAPVTSQVNLAPVVQPVAAKAPAGPSAADVEALRVEMSGLRNALEERNRDVSKLSQELAALKDKIRTAPAPKQAVAVKVEPPKPAKVEVARQESGKAIITEKAVVETPAVAKAAPPAAKGKVRSDYRMYAYSDERFWIKGDDGEPFLVGLNSPLPDGSRVIALNKDAGTVSTSAGEIK